MLTKTEIEELKSIHDYLRSHDPTISTLGFNLYISKYANKDKFAFHIERPREWGLNALYISGRKDFVCDFRDKSDHLTVCSDLAWAIYNLLILYGYNPFK